MLFLIKRGVDPNIDEGSFGTTLQIATAAGREEIVQLLIEHKADPNHHGDQFKTALQVATTAGNRSLVRLLLDKGADLTIQRGLWNQSHQPTFLRQD